MAVAYDNEQLCDRYTVILKNGYALALSEHPESSEGFARWILVDEYDADQLGRQVCFESLPENIQSFVLEQMNDDL